MILLEYHNAIIQETLAQKITGEKQESIDLRFADFDGITYHISTVPSTKSEFLVSIAISCFKALKDYGAVDVLRRIYGSALQETAEEGYDVTLKFNAEELASQGKDGRNSLKRCQRCDSEHIFIEAKLFSCTI
jgi:actin related protein 2/3 complex subunit 2